MTCARCDALERRVAALERWHEAPPLEAVTALSLKLRVEPWAARYALRLYSLRGRIIEQEPNLKQAVFFLRAVLGADAIETLKGDGYRLTDIGRAKIEAVLRPQTTPSDPDAADAERTPEKLRRARAA